MPLDWKAQWKTIRLDFQRLQDEMASMEAVLQKRDASSWDRAKALVDAAAHLCRFLTKCRDKGIFEDIARHAEDVSTQNDPALKDLASILKQEEVVLREVGLDHDTAAAVAKDVAEIMEGKWSTEPMLRTTWLKRVDAAINTACRYPKSEILVMARNFGEKVKELDKRYRIAKGVLIAGANAVAAPHIPEPVTVTKFSGWIAALLIWLASNGDKDVPGI